jgi:hypothetical protein
MKQTFYDLTKQDAQEWREEIEDRLEQISAMLSCLLINQPAAKGN